MASKQVKVSIPSKEYAKAEKAAKKECFPTTTAYIRHVIRTKTAEED
jgi:hypothetical protein